MPGKKGSRVAASQARAKAAAKKKSRASAPDLTAARQAPPPTTEHEAPETDGHTAELAEAMATAETPARAAAAPAPSLRRTRVATRRERQAMTVAAAGSLKWELSLIGALAAVMGVALALIKLLTEVGR